MGERVDLSNPDFEPTDAQLTELSARAFSGVRAAHEKALRELRARIAIERLEIMRSFDTSRRARARR